MNGMKIFGAVSASILAITLGAGAIACGSSSKDESPEVVTAKTVSAASVSIEIYDANNVRIGDGSGVLLAPRLVLTSGHLIAGATKWIVKSADGKIVANSSRGMNYDWQKYDSTKAHPRRHDVGVLHLETAIKLDAYPRLVAETVGNNTKATRLRGTGASFQAIEANLEKFKTSPNAFLTDAPGETLDTGGAVYDARGIIGIVSGRGMTTNKLYVAKVNDIAAWLSPKVACAGGAAGVRTYAEGAPKATDCDDAGNPIGSGTNGGNNGGAGADHNGNTLGPGDDTNAGSCDTNFNGLCFGGLCALLGTPAGTNGSPEGQGSPTTNPNTNGSPEGQGSPNSNGGAGGQNGSTGSNGTTTANKAHGGITGQGGAGSFGTQVGSSSNKNGASSIGGAGANNPNSPEGQGSPGANGGAGGGATNTGADTSGSSLDNFCQGANDNPEVCPPEPDGCAGSSCGGGDPDDSIDYGGMGRSDTSGGKIDVR